VPFNLAPILSLASVLFLWAVVPLASRIYGVDLNVALLYLVAAGSIGTLLIIMAGWASNNKYALLGAYRMVANMISYEIPMVVALLIPTVLAGSMSLKVITEAQSTTGGVWFVLISPLGALIFLIAAIAELGRSPFDLNEGESEIVSGYHIEYSGMKFGLFYAGELLHAFTFGGFVAALFFCGWHGHRSCQPECQAQVGGAAFAHVHFSGVELPGSRPTGDSPDFRENGRAGGQCNP
jgi:NADH-quinone oxidoreductase subunit H